MTLPLLTGTADQVAQANFEIIARAWPNAAVGAFSAYRNAALNTVGGGVLTITFDVEEFDVSGWYDTSNGRYTPLIAGYYRLSAAVRIPAVNNATNYRLYVAKGGTPFKELKGEYRPTVAAQPMTLGGSALVLANGTTDYFQVQVDTTDIAVALNVGGAGLYTYFQGEMIVP